MIRPVQVISRTGELLATYMIDHNFMGDEPNDHEFRIAARKRAANEKLVKPELLDELRYEVGRG